MGHVTFRPSASCDEDSFRALMETIRSMPEVETIVGVRLAPNPIQSMGLYTACLFDDADKLAVKRAIALLPEVEWVMYLDEIDNGDE